MCIEEIGILFILCRISELLSAVVPMLVALGVVYLVWGIVQYVIGDSEEAKSKGRDTIIFGIIGLAVIISMWGLVYLLQDTFEMRNKVAPDKPTLQGLLP